MNGDMMIHATAIDNCHYDKGLPNIIDIPALSIAYYSISQEETISFSNQSFVSDPTTSSSPAVHFRSTYAANF